MIVHKALETISLFMLLWATMRNAVRICHRDIHRHMLFFLTDFLPPTLFFRTSVGSRWLFDGLDMCFYLLSWKHLQDQLLSFSSNFVSSFFEKWKTVEFEDEYFFNERGNFFKFLYSNVKTYWEYNGNFRTRFEVFLTIQLIFVRWKKI